ncbi:MAG: dihydrodipicolinate reductase, partial [Desulfurococcaceae archaeon]
MDIGIYGFGSIGRLLAKYAIERGYNIVGVYDIDKSIIGKDIGELIGLSGKYGVEVSSDPLDLVNSDVVYHATSSYLDT